jgi:hypothetical protein
MAANGQGTTRLAQMLYLWRTVNHLSLRDAPRARAAKEGQ